MKSRVNHSACLLLALAVVFLGDPNIEAATLTVTSTTDSGPGTLRAALASANNGDTIDATGVSGTILLTSGELMVSNSVTILGSGPNNLAVDGNAASRVFHVSGDALVTISGLIISNGLVSANSGGGIYNENAILTLSNCIVSGNFADYDGGGIWNWGLTAKMTIVNSKISGNFATFEGGGIENVGVSLLIANSTVSGNTATNQDDGGGICNFASVLTVSNCTVSGNLGYIGGGIFSLSYSGESSALVTIANSTINGNTATIEGGGICNFFRSSLFVFNSTISGNSALQGGGIDNTSGEISDENVAATIISCTVSSNSAAPILQRGGAG